ncbi:MAG: SDR family NAD(P)-dependent oxidoreductase [Ilumatobacteraceae bacterium]
MANALGEPTSVVLFGGTSEIGVAILSDLIGPTTRRVTLACRDVAAGGRVAEPFRREGCDVEVVEFEATKPEMAAHLIESVCARAGDLDLVVVAQGILGDPRSTVSDPSAAEHLLQVNAVSTIGCVIAAGSRMRLQGHGTIVVVSSVAGERVRRANPTYGSSKAALDSFAVAYGDLVEPDGVHVLVVRPGFVHTVMTRGLRPAPFATTTDVVAAATVKGLRSERRVVWAPPILRYVFMVLRHLPSRLWQRLSKD